MQRLSEVGSGLRGIGTSMFTGTRELLEHVTEAISSELDSIEGMAARNKPQRSQSTNRQGARIPETMAIGLVHPHVLLGHCCKTVHTCPLCVVWILQRTLQLV